MTKASDTANILKQPFVNTLGTSNYRAGVNAGDTIALASNTAITSNITLTSNITNGTAITNLIHEDRENDAKRQIKIIKSDFVPSIISQFENLMKT